MKYSFIIPVYNRPEEIVELLQSMAALDYEEDFEIVIIEDGSTRTSEDVIDKFEGKLVISYFQKPNTGPGDSRNVGMKRATGNYFLILDSDVILPRNYLKEVDDFLTSSYSDCFGGPDAAHECFTDVQKAINYSMTSFWTTGGIRGKKKSVTKFQPRSFNMGLSREAFEASGGFGPIHPGEDPDLSLRLQNLGFKTVFLPGAVVFHKRRIDWRKFFQQVYKFGLVRPILNKWHPSSSKITYWFPSIFIVGFICSVFLLLFQFPYFFIFYLLYFILIGLDAGIKNKSINIGLTAILATIVQFFGYGYGFIKSVININILNKKPEAVFPQLFFNDAKQKEAV